ncbi:unnamed protein product [Colias eurytheme]|nr:unnamed protein product [Colias eurytheme]
MHPDGTAHGGSAVLIRQNIKHHEIIHYCTEQIQATNVVIEDWVGPFIISAVYSPPKHQLKCEDYEKFFSSFDTRFIAGGDYNAKHQYWGSRTITTKGRQLLMAIDKLKLGVVSAGKPTYWPTDSSKIPDLLDFYVIRGLSPKFITCKTSTDLSSDHSPVEITLRRSIAETPKPCRLHSNRTNWELFRQLVAEKLELNIQLKSNPDIVEAVEHFNNCIQQSAWYATPSVGESLRKETCPKSVRELLAEKRKARKRWQSTGFPVDKKHLNYLQMKLKTLLHNIDNQNIQTSLERMDATAETNFSLWKASKKLKQPVSSNPPIRKGNTEWASSDAQKADTFAEHLEQVFTPNPDMGSLKNPRSRPIIKSKYQSF